MPTPAIERQVEQPQGAAARESIARQPDGAAQDGGALAFDVQSVLGLQAAAGNAAVAALLARTAARPPGQILSSLAGVEAAIAQAGRREHDALAASPPRWHVQPDQTSPSPLTGEQAFSQRTLRESAGGIPEAGRGGGAAEDPELQHHHSAFHRTLARQAEAEADQAGVPAAGEHSIVASGTSGAIVAAIAERPLAPTPSPIEAAEDEGVSQVAADERGPEIARAVGGGSAVMAALTAEHAGKQAEIGTQTDRQLSLAEAENRSQRDAERGAAIEEVAGLRRGWGDERGALLTVTSAQGQAAGETARAAIAQHHLEAERAAAAARVQGKREAQKAQSQGPGGILGAIGSAAQAVVERVGQAVTAVLRGAEGLAMEALERGKRLIRATVATAAQAFTAAAARSRSLLAAARDRFRQAIEERVARAKAAVTGLMARLQTAVKRTLDAAALARAASVHALAIGWHAALEGVRSVVQGAIQFARKAVEALGAFASLVRDVAANPGQWIANLAAGAQDGIRDHLWPDLQQAVREWFDGKVQAVLGLGAAVWGVLQRGGITLAEVGHVVWEGIKAAIPPALISILIEKIVSLLVPAAAAALLIVQAIQAAWGSLSRIIQAFDAFMRFLKAVRWGDAGPLFGKAMAAGAVALIDFVSNFLLQRLGGPIKRVASRLRSLGKTLAAKTRAVASWLESANASRLAGKHAVRLVRKARAEAPRVRADLGGLAESAGGRMEGLDFEVKTPDSLKRKITARLAAGVPPEAIDVEIKDVLRYTMTFDERAYTGGVERVVAALRNQGYKEVRIKNYWAEGGERYKGINAIFESPRGQRFELQLHTQGPEGSWFAKQFGTHDLYEEWRTTKDPAREKALYELMVERWKRVRTPEGAASLGDSAQAGGRS